VYFISAGDILPSDGDAIINGYSILTNIAQVRREVGYTPQFDPLIELMTAYEQLSMYARFRGINPSYIHTAVHNMILRLQLEKYAHKPAGTYSGGNKRKLSLAIALIGNPSVIFLDEPSSGMDPVSRRFMWSVISSLTHVNRSSILTSHSMEEVEALCNRIGIMINGQLKCLGSIQHLKNKFGQGYYMEFASHERYTRDIQSFVAKNFNGAVLEEVHSGRLKYQLPRDNVSLASIFGLIEENKDRLRIDDYCVSQSTLEQIFLVMAKQQSTPMHGE
jgi:ABC-type multidrug transport system ATPase subunit